MSNIPDNEPSGRGWLSIAWGLAVIAGFVAIQGVRHYSGKRDVAAATQPQSDEAVQALLDKGISVNIVIHSCSEEYAKGRTGDLNLTRQAADIESTVTIGGQTKTMRSRSDNQAPNQDAGEVDRCRLVFDDNGRVFLNTHERAALGGAEILDVTASYELEIVEGSRADFEAGREIRLAYTAKALEERREALRNSLAVQWRPILQRQVPTDSTTNFDMKCVVEPLPQSSIVATPSSLFIEDGGPVRATITVAVSRR
jgi:hypothetical protein